VYEDEQVRYPIYTYIIGTCVHNMNQSIGRYIGSIDIFYLYIGIHMYIMQNALLITSSSL
jgi:hypothetical protein